MKKSILIIFLCFTTLCLAQKRIDSTDCFVKNYDNVKEKFFKTPSCNNYAEIKKLVICKRNTIQDFSIIYIAAHQSNCIQAHQDLFNYYKQLNFELSKKDKCSRDTLLLENLDSNSIKLAVKSLLQAQIDKSTIAGYYYYGTYVTKDKRLAIKFLRESYNYDVTENDLIEELDQMKELLIPCSNSNNIE
jgi:hypothetical protein